MKALIILIQILAAQPQTPAPKHTIRPVTYRNQTPAERAMTHSDEWDCFRRGRQRFTTCEKVMPHGSILTVQLTRVVTVK